MQTSVITWWDSTGTAQAVSARCTERNITEQGFGSPGLGPWFAAPSACSCCLRSRIGLPGCPAPALQQFPAQPTNKAGPRVPKRKTLCEPFSMIQRSGKAPLCSGAIVEVPPARLLRRRQPKPWPPAATPAGIPLALWDPAHPLLTQSLGHVIPLGGVRWVLPAES